MTDLPLKFSGLVSLVKLPNVLILLSAQLLVAWRVFMTQTDLRSLLFDRKFVFMLLATGSAISAGYIINHFYNIKRDLINRPVQTRLGQQVSTKFQLYVYFGLSFLSVIFALFISWRAFAFFSIYNFLIWVYFHKIQPKAFWNELFVTFLIVFPFFGVMLFFKKWDTFILWSGILFVLILFRKELIKNHLTLRGDVVQNIRTLLIVKGERFQKIFFLISFFLTLVPVIRIYLMDKNPFFNTFLLFLVVMLFLEMIFYVSGKYFWAYQINKMILISGVLALFLL